MAIVILIAVLAGLGGASGLAYAYVKSKANQLQTELTMHLELGQADLQHGKDHLKQASTKHDIKLVNAAVVDFRSARAEFATTQSIADGSRLLADVERVPEVGGQAKSLHRAVDGVAVMGMRIADAGIDLTGVAGDFIAPQAGGQAGTTLLTVLNNANALLPKVRAELQAAARAAEGVDPSVIPAAQQQTLIKAQGSIATAITDLDQFAAYLPIFKEIFGANGPRNYLIEQVNPAELRPGGGFIGSYSVLQADQGTLKLLRSGDSYDITEPRPRVGQSGYVAPPDPMRDLVPAISWSLVDSNFFPDFPSNALAAERFAAPRLGMNIDAVISFDYYTVSKLLELTGPIQVPGFGAVNATNFIPTVVSLDLQGNATHKVILAATAGPLMQMVSNFTPDRWPALLTTLNDLASSRHLQVYFNNAAVESLVDTFGWTSRIDATPAYDFMAENEANLGATKANYFLTRQFSVVLTRAGNVLHHQVAVSLTDDMPYSYRPNEYYRAYLRLFFPGSASGASDDLTRLQWKDPAPPSGMSQLTGWVSEHGYGHTITRTFVYDTPWPGHSRGLDDIYWQKQPGTGVDKFDVTWNDGLGHSFTASSDLGQDRVIHLSPSAVVITTGQAGHAALPSLSLG